MAAEFDYIVVGSGAGGGPLACRLAQDPAGYRVALLEAGTDPTIKSDGSENYRYSVPVFHGFASEDHQMSWEFFVRHYSNDERQKKDSKIYPPEGHPADPDKRRAGIFYPRAGTLGGCTAHNAMITVYPHNEDWDYVKQLTGDASWDSGNMRKYFENLEDCRYTTMTPNEGRHGFGNWLSTSLLDLKLFIETLQDKSVVAIAVAAVKTVVEDALLKLGGEPNEAQILALLDRVAHLRSLLRSVVERLPPEKKASLTKILTLLEGDRDKVIAGFKSLLPEIKGLFATQKQSGFLEIARQKLIDLIVEKFLNNVLNGMPLADLIRLVIGHLDPNDWRVVQSGVEGIFAIPLATDGVRRSGPRDLIQATMDNCPYRLDLMTGVLVTKVIFEGTRAVGVRFIRQENAYFASPLNQDRAKDTYSSLPVEEEIRVRREVILSGGAFNTPQLLMLSGVGPQAVLDTWRITPVGGKYWPGVGQNLQDRYEVAVIAEMGQNFQAIENCKFVPPDGDGENDPCFLDWKNSRKGVYTTNGALFSIIKRSSQAEHIVTLPAGASPSLPPPDLFLFSLLGYFKGYQPGYSDEIERTRNRLTWAILKGHTRNSKGEITLRSADPRDTPLINFKYFGDDDLAGNPDAVKDADALIEGMEFVQRMLDHTGAPVNNIIWPVPINLLHDPTKRDELRQFILNETWGHHACGTCKIGLDPGGTEQAVLDSNFRVHGLQGLRVVDASVFPKIPGFFIVTSIYMISEKAADVILADAKTQ